MTVGSRSHTLPAGHGRLLRAWLVVAAVVVAAVLALTLWAGFGEGNTEPVKQGNTTTRMSDGFGGPIWGFPCHQCRAVLGQ